MYSFPVVELITHTNPPPTATPFGASEKLNGTVLVADADRASTASTVPSSAFATQIVVPWADTAPGFRPTPTAPATVPERSMWTTVFGRGLRVVVFPWRLAR